MLPYRYEGTKEHRARIWQERAVRVGEKQARYLGLLTAFTLFYFALLLSGSSTSSEEIPLLGVRIPSVLLLILGPYLLGTSIRAAYGSMRMLALVDMRLRAHGLLVPCAFGDTPNFLDAAVFAPRWARTFERRIATMSVPLVLASSWLIGFITACRVVQYHLLPFSPLLNLVIAFTPLAWALYGICPMIVRLVRTGFHER